MLLMPTYSAPRLDWFLPLEGIATHHTSELGFALDAIMNRAVYFSLVCRGNAVPFMLQLGDGE